MRLLTPLDVLWSHAVSILTHVLVSASSIAVFCVCHCLAVRRVPAPFSPALVVKLKSKWNYTKPLFVGDLVCRPDSTTISVTYNAVTLSRTTRYIARPLPTGIILYCADYSSQVLVKSFAWQFVHWS